MTGTHSSVSVIYCFYSCSQGQSFTPPSNAWWCYIQQSIVICGDLGGVLLGPGVLRDEVDADAALVHGGAAARVVEGGRVAAAGQTVRAGAELGHAAANQRRVFTILSTNHSSPGQAGRTGAALGVAPRVVEVAAAGARGLGQRGVEDGGGGAGVGRVLGVGHLEAVAVQAARPVHVGGRGQRGRGLARQVGPAA